MNERDLSDKLIRDKDTFDLQQQRIKRAARGQGNRTFKGSLILLGVIGYALFCCYAFVTVK